MAVDAIRRRRRRRRRTVRRVRTALGPGTGPIERFSPTWPPSPPSTSLGRPRHRRSGRVRSGSEPLLLIRCHGSHSRSASARHRRRCAALRARSPPPIGSIAVYAMPGFWLGLVLIVIFAVDLRWLPSGGIESVASGKAGLDRALDIGRHLFLPVASLGLVYLALYLRLMRDGMANLWSADFVRGAQARGLPRWRIVIGHVARNALLPVVTMLGLQSASMLGGSVVIESVFAVPGLGRLASEAVAQRDMPLLLGVLLCSACS